MLRKLIAGAGVALAISVGMVSASGLAQASIDQSDEPPTNSGTWVFIKWYPGGNSLEAYYQCVQDARNNYPGRDYECRHVGDTTQLWVWFAS